MGVAKPKVGVVSENFSAHSARIIIRTPPQEILDPPLVTAVRKEAISLKPRRYNPSSS